MSTRPVDDVLELFAMKGDECYGEAISQRHHALQCAVVVQEAGSADELVAAALLHDIGHLVADREFGARSDMSLEDDRQEAVGARWVARRFGPQVARPIALHVVAKRYRCTVDPLYYDALSPTSKATLQAQGGRLAPDAVRRFEADPGFAAALVIRDTDEAGKDADAEAPPLEDFVPLLDRVARSRR